MSDERANDIQPVHAKLTPVFEARWSYDEFIRLMPFGEPSEGQAYAYSTTGRIESETFSGTLRLSQYPRWRIDGVLLPDVHGMIQTDSDTRIAIRAGGYGLQVPNAPGDRTVYHWMRFWTTDPKLAWLNTTLAFGIGGFSNASEEARLSYFAVTPSPGASAAPPGAPELELLGTAQWRYPEYHSVHPFDDAEGIGYATSTGAVAGGPLAGSWRGWHYPTYRRDDLYQIDAHAEIRTAEGVILNRHGGLATQPSRPADGLLYDIVQHATFITEIPKLANLNDKLAIGVGFVHDPGHVTVSYYSLAVPR